MSKAPSKIPSSFRLRERTLELIDDLIHKFESTSNRTDVIEKAVEAMHTDANHGLPANDFRTELYDYREPYQSMRWLQHKLNHETGCFDVGPARLELLRLVSLVRDLLTGITPVPANNELLDVLTKTLAKAYRLMLSWTTDEFQVEHTRYARGCLETHLRNLPVDVAIGADYSVQDGEYVSHVLGMRLSAYEALLSFPQHFTHWDGNAVSSIMCDQLGVLSLLAWRALTLKHSLPCLWELPWTNDDDYTPLVLTKDKVRIEFRAIDNPSELNHTDRKKKMLVIMSVMINQLELRITKSRDLDFLYSLIMTKRSSDILRNKHTFQHKYLNKAWVLIDGELQLDVTSSSSSISYVAGNENDLDTLKSLLNAVLYGNQYKRYLRALIGTEGSILFKSEHVFDVQ